MQNYKNTILAKLEIIPHYLYATSFIKYTGSWFLHRTQMAKNEIPLGCISTICSKLENKTTVLPLFTTQFQFLSMTFIVPFLKFIDLPDVTWPYESIKQQKTRNYNTLVQFVTLRTMKSEKSIFI